MAVSTVNALEVLTAKELVSHCALHSTDPKGTDGQYCIRNIQGFIDGVISTDARVMLNAENAIIDSDTFSERRIRTGMPGNTDRYRAAQLTGFGLGDFLHLRNEVDLVLAKRTNKPVDEEKDEPTMECIYQSLLINHPCQQ
jgi:hypothetical protein